MTEEDKLVKRVAADMIDNPGYAIGTVLTNEQYEAKADEFQSLVIEEMTKAGLLTSADMFFVSVIRNNYRAYIGLRDEIGGVYSKADRFGDKKVHPLLNSYMAFGKVLVDNFKQGGLTPGSRDFKGGNSGKVPHGNSESAGVLDIINE